MLGLPPTALDHPASYPRKRERDSVIPDRRQPQSAVTLNPRVFVGRAWGMATLIAGSRPGTRQWWRQLAGRGAGTRRQVAAAAAGARWPVAVGRRLAGCGAG